MKKIIIYIVENIWLIVLIALAFLAFSIMNFRSGSYQCFNNVCGYFFWGSHSHDGIWHIAIAENAFKSIPFQMPTYLSSKLTGYNYFFDIIIFIMSKFGISPILSYFKILPIVWFILFTYLLIIFARKLNKSKMFVWLFLFFSYFAGSFSYYFTIIKDKTIIGSSGYLAQLFQHLALNFQFSFSLIPLLYILIKLKENKISTKTIIFFGFLIFINMGLKFYGGIITYILVISYLLLVIRAIGYIKLIKNLIIINFFFIVSIFIFYNPFESLKTGSIFVFSPFTFIHPITEDPSLFYMQKLTDARYALQSAGISIKLMLIELFNLLLFLFFYFGVRFIGLLYGGIKVIKSKRNNFDLAILATIGVSIILTTLFIQKGEWTNIVQFLYYGIFLTTIYTAEFTYNFFIKNKKLGWLIAILIILLSLPATLDTIRLYAQNPGTTYLPKDEMEALTILKKMPEGVVFSPLYDTGVDNKNAIKELKEKNIPLPLYAWNDTAYVTAFSGKQSYLSDLWMERITGINYEARLKKVLNNDCSFLKEVDYLYNNNYYQIDRKLFDCPNRLKLIYGNRSATIYKVEK
jgi:hypothetical protein